MGMFQVWPKDNIERAKDPRIYFLIPVVHSLLPTLFLFFFLEILRQGLTM
jgi:hypothetical protein